MVFNQPDSTFLASSQLITSIDNAIVLSLFMLSFFFVIVCGLLKWKQIYVGFFIVCFYRYCHWRSGYQKGMGVIP